MTLSERDLQREGVGWTVEGSPQWAPGNVGHEPSSDTDRTIERVYGSLVIEVR